MENNISYDIPISEILKGKSEYHKKQILYHQNELAEINRYLSGKPNPLKSSPKESKSDNNKVASQTLVRPLVEDYLRDNRGKHITTEIYDGIKNNIQIIHEERRNVVGSISVCLAGLTNGGKPKVKKYDTDKGNIKAYEWTGN